MRTHVDEEVIAAVALGDPAVSAPDAAHVRGCARCGALLAEFDRVQNLLRRPDVSEDGGPALDPGVWEQIADATREEPSPVLELPSERRPPLARPDLVASAGHRRRTPAAFSRPLLLAAAALVCVLAGIGIGRLVWGAPTPSAEVLASTSLAALDGSRTLGEARLLDEAGRTELQVSAMAAPSGPGFVEVWLLNEDGQRMVSLGVLDTSQSVFAVPPGAVTEGYRIVDLSREQYDGDARHSGDSLMRGTLPA